MNVVIVTHGDVDGMTCAAQILRIEGLECDLIFSNAVHIGRHLASVARLSNSPKRLYIADIPADSASVDAVTALRASGVETHWVDHHPWTDGLRERLERAEAHVVYRESLRHPAGVLMGQWLANRDAHCLRIARICYSAHKGTEWERDWFRLLSSQTARCDRSVLERLAKDEPFTDEDRTCIAAQMELEDAVQMILAEPPTTITTTSGYLMAIYDTSITPHVYLGDAVFRCHPVDLCIHRISAMKWQISVRRGADPSLGALRGQHTLSGFTVNIGGRDSLLSVTASGQIPEDAHNQLLVLVMTLL